MKEKEQKKDSSRVISYDLPLSGCFIHPLNREWLCFVGGNLFDGLSAFVDEKLAVTDNNGIY